MKTYSRVCAKINLNHITYNIEQMRHHISPDTNMILVVKADGYGHGATRIAKETERLDCVWGYATATLDEAVLLRKAGVQKPILVLGCTFPEQYEEAIRHEIRMTIYTEQSANAVSKLAGKLKKPAWIHVKLDTGMSRLGFQTGEESIDEIERIFYLPGIRMEGLFTHFAKADEMDKTFTNRQMEEYLFMTRKLKERGIEPQYRHCSNSAAIIDHPEANLDLVRAGIALYGLYPSDEVRKRDLALKPVLSLVSSIVHTKWIEPGAVVSYGGCFRAEKKTRVATIPVGYADGYPRSLSNKGYVLIRGKRAPIIGRVCMDQMMVDVTEIDEAAFMDEVVLVGKSGREEITVDDLSALSGRINYVFLCYLDKRIPREYVIDGEVIEQVDYFA